MSTAVYALIAIIAVFLALVAVSWLNLDIPIITSMGDFLAGILHAIIAFFQALLGGAG